MRLAVLIAGLFGFDLAGYHYRYVLAHPWIDGCDDFVQPRHIHIPKPDKQKWYDPFGQHLWEKTKRRCYHYYYQFMRGKLNKRRNMLA